MGLNQTFKIHYDCVPRLKEFQKDSSVTFAFRNDDTILKHIDWLLERYEARTRDVRTFDLSKGRVILCDLYLTCGYWIKSLLAKTPWIRPERYPAVFGLFEASTRELMLFLQCGRGDVEKAVMDIYGRSLSHHGVKADEVKNSAYYLTEAERQIYRVWFKGGLAFQVRWWERNPGRERVLADSKHAYNAAAKIKRPGAGETTPNYGAFVMTMDREVYMTIHFISSIAGNGLFHSSYTYGKPVIFAGTMLIEAGVVKAVRRDSGHYHTTEQNMAGFLQGLSMFGVNLRQIQLFDEKATPVGNAEAFMMSHMSWDEFLKQRQNEYDHRAETEAFRVVKGVPRKYPNMRLTPAGGVGQHAPAYSSVTTPSVDNGDKYNNS